MVKNPGTKQHVQRILGDCWQWESNRKCCRVDNCSFRHDINKRGKMTQSKPFPNSVMQQNERKASKTRSPRRRNPSGKMYRWPCKDYLKGTCINFLCDKWHPPECLFYKTKSGCRFGVKVLIRTPSGLMNMRIKKVTNRMMTKVLWLYWRRVFGKKKNLSPQGNLWEKKS